MLWLMIGLALAIIGWHIKQKDTKDALHTAAFWVLLFIGTAFVLQDIYYEEIVKTNITHYYNGGAGITYVQSITANNTTTYVNHKFYDAYDPVVGEYLAYVKAEGQAVPFLSTTWPYLTGILVLYGIYTFYMSNLKTIGGGKNEKD